MMTDLMKRDTSQLQCIESVNVGLERRENSSKILIEAGTCIIKTAVAVDSKM